MISKDILKRWEKQHWQNICQELRDKGIELRVENIPRIIRETSFEVRSKEYPERCTLYSKGVSCHPDIKNLNCLACACPNYDTETEGGECRIQSKKGHMYKGEVWDCSDCSFGHSPEYIERFLKEGKLEELQRISETL